MNNNNTAANIFYTFTVTATTNYYYMYYILKLPLSLPVLLLLLFENIRTCISMITYTTIGTSMTTKHNYTGYR